MGFKKGQILIGAENENDKAFNPLIFWSVSTDKEIFIGLFLTSQKKGHILLDDGHISWLKPQPRKSNFPNRLLFKKRNWGPFTRIESLAESGLKYVQDHLTKDDPVYWEDLKQQILSKK